MRTLSLAVMTAAGLQKVPVEGKPITLGRSSDNTIALNDGQVSRFHCVITPGAIGLEIKDLGSRNGTKVNDIPIKSELLQVGDVITLGDTVVTVMLEALSNGPAGAVGGVAGVEQKGRSKQEVKAAVEEEDPFAGGEYDVEEPEVEEELAVTDDPISVLRAKARSFPGDSFSELDIVILNARRQIAHGSEAKNKVGGRPEAIVIFRLLLLLCFRTHASDLHIEPKQDDCIVRLRIDGSMVDIVRLDLAEGQRLVSVVKVICDLDIAQREKVQEGHFSTNVPYDALSNKEGYRHVDYRCSFAPSVGGQKLVVRVLDPGNAPVKVSELGLPKWMCDNIEEAIQADSGMVLACGPTGSGKTTSLYAMLRTLNLTERNVVTIEDPVEIQIEGLTQLPVKEAEGKTFLNLLKTVLRQDPDVILIGEIRDNETAKVALQAAVTGHLVFSTVHTKDSVGAIFRLLDLGVEPYSIAQGLHLVLAQRLVRQLCPFCKVAVKPTPQQVAMLEKYAIAVPAKVFKAKGCGQCMKTGYAGRRAIFELLTATEELRDTIIHTPTASAIIKALAPTGFVRLAQNGYELVAQGILSFEEVGHVVGK